MDALRGTSWKSGVERSGARCAREFGVYSHRDADPRRDRDPAVIARFVTDITLGYSSFQAVKPKKRADLY
jgi:hypothetical protein